MVTSDYNKKEADLQIQKTNQWLPGGEGVTGIKGYNLIGIK